jgi:adenylate kinase family enzyme
VSRVILIIGVPGAGKSTVARALATHFDRSACLEGDLVQHHFTVSGLVGPDEASAEEAHRQLRLRWRNCAALADNFADEDSTVSSNTPRPMPASRSSKPLEHQAH